MHIESLADSPGLESNIFLEKHLMQVVDKNTRLKN